MFWKSSFSISMRKLNLRPRLKFPTVLVVKKIFLKIQHRSSVILGFPFSSAWVPKILITTCRFQVWKALNCFVCYCQRVYISFWQILQFLLQRLAIFSQFEDRVKNIMFSFKYYFKKTYISSHHTIFSLQENSVPNYYENPSKAKFIKGVYYLLQNQLTHVVKPYKS